MIASASSVQFRLPGEECIVAEVCVLPRLLEAATRQTIGNGCAPKMSGHAAAVVRAFDDDVSVFILVLCTTVNQSREKTETGRGVQVCGRVRNGWQGVLATKAKIPSDGVYARTYSVNLSRG